MVTSVAPTVISFLKPNFHMFCILQETWFNCLSFSNVGHDKKKVFSY